MKLLKEDWQRGDSIRLPADWLSAVARGLNTLAVRYWNQAHTWVQREIAGDLTIWLPNKASAPVRWQGVPTGTAGQLQVYVGAWTRNGYLPAGVLLELEPDSGKDYKTLSGLGGDDYVWAVLSHTAGTKQASLKPTAVTLASGDSLPDDYSLAGVHWLLGKFTDGVWQQWWWGGDIDDHWHLPDGDGADIGSLPYLRYTLQRNPEDTAHEAEDQLYGVHSTALDTWAIPYFPCDASDHIGTLTWAAIDSYAPVTLPTSQTLEILTPGTGTGVLQVYGFDEALDQQALIADVTGSPRHIGYAYPALFEDDPRLTGNGSGPSGSTYYWSAIGSDASELGVAPSLALQEDGTTLRLTWAQRRLEVSDGRIHIGAVSEEAHYAEVDLSDLVSGLAPDDHDHAHSELTDIIADAAAVADHDGRYWPRTGSAGYTAPDDGDYATDGDVLAAAFMLPYGGPSPENEWSPDHLWVQPIYEIVFTTNSYFNMACAELQIDGTPGKTVTVLATDPATGNPVTLTFVKGICT